MVGAVVDKGYVAWQRQELQGAIQDINTGHNLTHSIDGSVMVTTAAPGNNSSSSAGFDSFFRTKHLTELEAIKVGYAMAVTFAVGLLQVRKVEKKWELIFVWRARKCFKRKQNMFRT